MDEKSHECYDLEDFVTIKRIPWDMLSHSSLIAAAIINIIWRLCQLGDATADAYTSIYFVFIYLTVGKGKEASTYAISEGPRSQEKARGKVDYHSCLCSHWNGLNLIFKLNQLIKLIQ